MAQSPAVTSFSGGTPFLTIDGTNMTVGWSFTPTVNVAVSALGFWENDTSVALLANHQVGVWTSGGVLVTSGTVLTTSPATGNWRYVSVTPVVLLGGQTYVIGTTVTNPTSDAYIRVPVSGGSVTTSNLIAIGNSAISPSASGFAFPNTPEAQYLGRFGPNLIVQALAPPSISKAFGSASIALNTTTSLSFTIQNSGAIALTGIGFTDSLPAGLAVATPNGLTGSCGGGTITATAGSSSVSLSGASLAGAASCTFSITVLGSTAGTKNNATSAVTSVEAGNGNTATASLAVVAPPVISKSFGAATIPLNGTTSLSFTIQNNNTSGLTGVGFTDNLPAGLAVATPNGLTGSCGGGTITATAGASSVSLSGATLAGSASCTFSVTVLGSVSGAKNNATSAVVSVEGGNGSGATASLTVVAPPSISKSFGAASIPLNGSTSLSFTIQNANTSGLTGVGFTDNLPAGLTVSTPNGLAGSCGAGTITAAAGSGSISLSGAALAASASCTFSVNVTGTTAGTKNNATSNVASTEGGAGNSATASVTVASPPVLTKTFGAAGIPLNGTTSLSFTIQNNNTSALNGVGFTDNLPAGLTVSTPNGLAGSCGAGTITADAGSGSISLSGAALAASASCTFSVNVTGTTAGTKNNATSNVASTEGGAGNSATASITVASPPVLTKTFGAAGIPLNGTTSLSFTIQNNNTSALNGVGFTDNLPAGLAVATPNGLTGSCGGGTITATAGSTAVSLAGAALAGSASCTFSVNVTGSTAGTKNNTTSAVTSTEGGTGAVATASLAVQGPPSLGKVFSPSSIGPNNTTSLIFTVTNPGTNALASTGVAFTDTLPAGLTVASSSGSVCGGTLTTTAPTSIALTGATIATGAQCQFTVTVTGVVLGQYTNVTGAVTSTNGGTGNTATATLSVAIPSVPISNSSLFLIAAGLAAIAAGRLYKQREASL